jgi:hypothetical protein
MGSSPWNVSPGFFQGLKGHCMAAGDFSNVCKKSEEKFQCLEFLMLET